ncbi:MAG: hypothetical protein CMP11_02230 [Zetaproteobacteria bacterium]|nr:hypothetical protein [Pseudobdellovibrionaceae bacterium]
MGLKSVILSCFVLLSSFVFCSEGKSRRPNQLQKEALTSGFEGLINTVRGPGILSLGASAVYACTYIDDPIVSAVVSLPLVGLTIGALSIDKQQLLVDMRKNSKEILGTLGYFTVAGGMLGLATLIATLPSEYKYDETHYFSILTEFKRLLSTTLLSSNPFVAGGTRVALLYRAMTLALGRKFTPEYLGGFS